MNREYRAALGRHVSRGALMLAALFALRQSQRVRRSIAETMLPEPGSPPSPLPHVSIILPVRNEENHIDAILSTLLAQEYPSFDVTVIDDGSTDTTPQLLSAWATRDARLRLHRVADLPPGWAGKAHALHEGVGLTTGEWLLFTDADTRHAPPALGLMVGHAVQHNDDLLSMFTEARLVGLGMRLLTPIGALLLIERATAGEARDPAHRHALAIGQYILVRRAAYTAIGGYAAPGMRDSFAEDVALAEALKRHGKRVDIVSGFGLVTNEQWTTWNSAWRGWRKSAYAEVATQPLAGLVSGLVCIAYGVAPVLIVGCMVQHSPARSRVPAALALVTLVAQIDARACFDRSYGLSLRWSLTAPASWVLFGVLLLDTTRCALTRQGVAWRGRPAPQRGRTVAES